MTKIRLSKMEIRNFKKIHALDLEFKGESASITGANASGKTSIYKAYYWCLTGKTLEPNETIQTLDENNEIVHKVDTSVLVVFIIDDSYEVRLERKLIEEWRAAGMPNEQLKGTVQQRFFNDIPLSVAEFNAKLNSIYELDKLLLLSNINTFMGLKMEERRKLLMASVGEINEHELMADYPTIMKAVYTEKKSVDELQLQTLSTKKRANDELRTIPSQISAQDRLRVDYDFDQLKKQQDKLFTEVWDLDKQLEGSGGELEAMKLLRQKETEARNKLSEVERTLRERKKKELAEVDAKLREARKELDEAKETKIKGVNTLALNAEKLAALMDDFDKVKKQWIELNGKTADYEDMRECPTCGHVFSAEEMIDRREKALRAFNLNKSEQLAQLQTKAESMEQKILALKGVINEYNQIIKPTHENLVKEKETAFMTLETELSRIENEKITDDSMYQAAQAAVADIFIEINKASVSDSTKDELRARKNALMQEVRQLTDKLAYKEVNARIAEEKERLESRSVELSQTVADCDATLYQIKEYKKTMVDAIEEKVNSLFKIARWKFFKKNLSNDDYAEVCVCIHDGVDYNSTNTADKINLGCDIIYGLSRALGLQGVLFVDNKEAVADILKDSDVQLITLEHVPYAPLKLNTNN